MCRFVVATNSVQCFHTKERSVRPVINELLATDDSVVRATHPGGLFQTLAPPDPDPDGAADPGAADPGAADPARIARSLMREIPTDPSLIYYGLPVPGLQQPIAVLCSIWGESASPCDEDKRLLDEAAAALGEALKGML